VTQTQKLKQEKRIPVKSYRNESNRSLDTKYGTTQLHTSNEINLVEHPYREKKI